MMVSQLTAGSRVAVFAIVFLLAGASVAEDVEAIVKRGIELRRKGDDQAALAEFKRALAIKETPRVRAQVGLAEQALGLWLSAEEHLASAVKAERDPWVTRNRSALDSALAAIGAHLGTVEIWGGPAGAEVVINGTPAGKLPSAGPVRVIAGACSLLVRADGYQDTARTLQVGAGELVRDNVQLIPSVSPSRAVAAVTRAPPPTETLAVATPPAEQPADEHRGVTGKWWFWTAVGVVVAGGIAAAFLVTRPRGGLDCPSGAVCPP
jgi:hypothetical protein